MTRMASCPGPTRMAEERHRPERQVHARGLACHRHRISVSARTGEGRSDQPWVNAWGWSRAVGRFGAELRWPSFTGYCSFAESFAGSRGLAFPGDNAPMYHRPQFRSFWPRQALLPQAGSSRSKRQIPIVNSARTQSMRLVSMRQRWDCSRTAGRPRSILNACAGARVRQGANRPNRIRRPGLGANGLGLQGTTAFLR